LSILKNLPLIGFCLDKPLARNIMEINLMLRINVEKLVETFTCGEITHPQPNLDPRISSRREDQLYPPTTGIITNVKFGDPALGWAWGRHLVPGVCIRNKNPQENIALVALSCIGNEATILSAAAESKEIKLKGEKGVVMGKTAERELILHFPKRIMERLSIGDRIQIRSHGAGLGIEGYPEIFLINFSPAFLNAMNPSERHGKVRFQVTKVLSGRVIEAAGSNPWLNDYDIQIPSQEILKKMGLEMVRLGDLIAITDCESFEGPRFKEGAISLGVVIHGAGRSSSSGPGILMLVSSSEDIVEPIISRKANLAEIMGLS
jgi:hypothetical protein